MRDRLTETSIAKTERRSIPSLDGLRALSIVLVVALHTLQRFSMTHTVPLFWYVIFNGALGVRIFFVISGYLITHLLLKEADKTGSISLGRFYLRRAFRILPPLYAYIFFLCILGVTGHLAVSRAEIVGALIFIRNYAPHATMWSLEHTWSLCVEEQFYLIWPALLVWCLSRRAAAGGKMLAAKIALVVIAISPAIRIIFFRLHNPYFHNPAMFHMQADSLMFGCVTALLEGHRRFERIYERVTRYWWLPFVLLFGILSALDMRFQNYWNFPIGITIASFYIAMVLLWTVRNPYSVVGRILNFRPIAWLGTLSYSVYLWQTFFLHHGSTEVFGGFTIFNTFPGDWVMILLISTLSFYGIEQPALRLRDRLMRRSVPVIT